MIKIIKFYSFYTIITELWSKIYNLIYNLNLKIKINTNYTYKYIL